MGLRIISIEEAYESIVKSDSQYFDSCCRLSAKNRLAFSLDRDLINKLGIEVNLFNLAICLNQI